MFGQWRPVLNYVVALLRCMINGLHKFFPYKKVAIHLHSCKWIGEHVQYVQYVAMQTIFSWLYLDMKCHKEHLQTYKQGPGIKPQSFEISPIARMILHTNGLGSVFFVFT
jgi:hypothetical protein